MKYLPDLINNYIMGCIPTKKNIQTRKFGNFSESLPIPEDRYQVRLSLLKEFKRGMTINHAHIKKKSLILQEAYNRPEFDFDCMTAEILKRAKSSQEFSDIKLSLTTHFLFKEVQSSILDEIIDQMNFYSLQKGEFIFQQAEPGYNFFIVASGTVEILVNQKRAKLIERGECFGELALIHNSGRRASAKSNTRVRLWGLGRDTFKRIITYSINLRYNENKQFLQQIEVFKSLPQSKLEILLESAISQRFEKNEKIFLSGDMNSTMYIIKEGTVNIIKNTEKLISLGKGEYFGEISLIFNTLRNASAFAGSKCVILCFTEQVLNKVFGPKIQGFLYNNVIRIAFAKDQLLKGLSNEQVTRALSLFVMECVEGEVELCIEEFFYVVITGQACEVETGQVWKTFNVVRSDQTCSGGKELVKVVGTDCIICKIEKSALEKLLYSNILTCLESNKVLRNMKKILFLSYLPICKLEELSRVVEEKIFSSSEKIFSEGDDADFFYIVKSGSVKIIKQDSILSLVQKKEYFGERAFLFNEKRFASAVSAENTECWIVKKEVFLSLLNEKLQNYLKKKILLQEKNIELQDLKILNKLSKGAYSTTYLVQHAKNGVFYALKSIKKSDVFEYELLPRLKNEKKIHQICNFPFISTFVKSFKNSDHLFFLYEYVQGPALSKVLESQVALTMQQTKFYASIIVLTLEYLHSFNVIHREVAVTSFVLDNCGYPILTDFSNSKITENRTFTIIGLPFYLAPEVIKGQGYTYFADLWSLGILIYELLFGIVPYGHNKEDPYEIYQSILNDNFKYPVFIKDSQKPNGIIEKLLQKDPFERGTIEDIKKHEWFLGTDWEEFISQEVGAEFTPGLEKNLEDNDKASMNEIFPTDPNEFEVDWAEGI